MFVSSLNLLLLLIKGFDKRTVKKTGGVAIDDQFLTQ